MKYRIDDEGGNIDVRIERTGADDADLLAALERCREGRCDCPTDEYEKVEELRVERGEGGISVHLAVKLRIPLKSATNSGVKAAT